MKKIILLLLILSSFTIHAQTLRVDKGCSTIFVLTDSTAESHLKRILFNLGYQFEFSEGFWHTTNAIKYSLTGTPIEYYGSIEKTDTGYLISIKGRFDMSQRDVSMQIGTGQKRYLQIESRNGNATIYRGGFIEMIKFAQKLKGQIQFEKLNGQMDCEYSQDELSN